MKFKSKMFLGASESRLVHFKFRGTSSRDLWNNHKLPETAHIFTQDERIADWSSIGLQLLVESLGSINCELVLSKQPTYVPYLQPTNPAGSTGWQLLPIFITSRRTGILNFPTLSAFLGVPSNSSQSSDNLDLPR